MARLSEDTIGTKTSAGNTPLHMAAKAGRIHEIPKHLFRLDLFLKKNRQGQTALHLAAQYGHLDQVPRKFLTRKSLTVFNSDGNTPLYKAAGYEHIDQIPREFQTPEFLKFRARNQSAWTILHHLACNDTIDQVPPENITPLMWKAQNPNGMDSLAPARSALRAFACAKFLSPFPQTAQVHHSAQGSSFLATLG